VDSGAIISAGAKVAASAPVDWIAVTSAIAAMAATGCAVWTVVVAGRKDFRAQERAEGADVANLRAMRSELTETSESLRDHLIECAEQRGEIRTEIKMVHSEIAALGRGQEETKRMVANWMRDAERRERD
jgi:hypothetical protein